MDSTSRSERISLPLALVVVGLETRPRLVFDVANEGEQQRLNDWIAANPRIQQLINDALSLEGRDL